jgi:Kef-type K+ transport system membrane component KefB
MSELAILLLLAAAAFGVARWLRVPTIPALLCSGLVLPVLGLAPDANALRNVLELGLAFLVFAAGVELNPRRFAPQRRAALWVTGVHFVVSSAAAFLVARMLGFGPSAAVYLALALSCSSTLVALQELRRRQQMFEPFARMVIGVQLIQDLVMILAMVALAASPGGVRGVAGDLGAAALLTAGAVLGQRWVLPWLLVRRRPDEETLLLMILATLFVFLGLASLLGLPVIAGAFLAGFALSAFPLSGVVRGQLTTFSDFFGAIFFTALGASLTLPGGVVLLKALALAALFLTATPLLVAIVAERCGLSSRAAIESGLLLAQTSEFSLLLGLTGLHLGHIAPEVFSVIALLAVLTMTLTPFVGADRVVRWLLHHHPLRRGLGEATAKRRGHFLLLGFGAAGMWVVKPLRAAGHDVLVVDDDPTVIAQLEKAGIPCLRGDGSDEGTLQRAGAREAKLIIASMRRVQDARKVLRHAPGVPMVTRVFDAADAAGIEALGGTAILNSAAAGDVFMDWFMESYRGKSGATAACCEQG